MVHDLHSPSKARKQHGPSPSMVKVPKLDLPLPPASPRRRGSTAVLDEFYNFMPLTPAPAAVPPRNSSVLIMHVPISPQTPKIGPILSAASGTVAHMQSLQNPAVATTPIDEALPEPPELEQSSVAVQLSSQRSPQSASDIGDTAATDAVSVLRQSQNLEQHEILDDASSLSSGRLHKVNQSPGGRKSVTPRHFGASSRAASPELSQAYPRSWNGTPRGSGTQHPNSASSAGQQSSTPAEAPSGCPGDLVDGQHTLPQLLARNEVCMMSSDGIFGTFIYDGMLDCQEFAEVQDSQMSLFRTAYIGLADSAGLFQV